RDDELARASANAASARRQTRWLIAGLSAACGGCLGLGWWFSRRARGVAQFALVPARLETGTPSDWRQRALAAEQRAHHATGILRAGLVPHLARWLGGEL